jgi:hypothetical protein
MFRVMAHELNGNRAFGAAALPTAMHLRQKGSRKVAL